MPQLRGYTADLTQAPISGGRRATGEDISAAGGAVEVGHAVLKAGTAAMEALKSKDARYAIVEQAKLRQQTSKELEEAEISGAPTEPIREKLETELAKLRDNIYTKDGLAVLEYHSSNTLNVYDTAEANLKVKRSAAEAHTQGREMLASQAATLATHPAYLPEAITISDSFFDTFAGKLPPQKLAELKQAQRFQLNESAVRSWTMLDPTVTKKQLEAGEFDLTAEQRRQEIGFAEGQIRQRRADAEHEMRMADYRRQQLSDGARGEWNQEIFKGSAKTATILADKRLTPEHQEHLITLNARWLEHLQNKDRDPNPVLERELMLRIYAPEGTPGKIYTADAVYDALAQPNGLSVTQFRRLFAEVANARDPNNSTVNQRFSESMRMVDQAVQADPAFIMQPWFKSAVTAEWAGAVRALMDQERQAGRNPARLFNPSDKDWVMRPEFVQQFVLAARRSAAVSAAGQAGAQGAADVKGPFPDGKFRKYKGSGDPLNWKENWDIVDAPKSSAAAAQAAQVHPVFNGVSVPAAQVRSESLTQRIQRAYPKRPREHPQEYAQRIVNLSLQAQQAGAE